MLDGVQLGRAGHAPERSWPAVAERAHNALHTPGPSGFPDITPPPARCGTTTREMLRRLGFTEANALCLIEWLRMLDELPGQINRRAQDAAKEVGDGLRGAFRDPDAEVREAARKAMVAGLKARDARRGFERWTYNQLLNAWDSLPPEGKAFVGSVACGVLGHGTYVVTAPLGQGAPVAGILVAAGCGALVVHLDGRLPRNIGDGSGSTTTPATTTAPPALPGAG